jgi:hypothetical protein
VRLEACGVLTAAMACAAGLGSLGGPSADDVPVFLRQHVGLSQGQVAALERGEAVTKALETHQSREVELFAAVRLDASGQQFVDAYRDITRFKRGDSTLAIDAFSDPPSLGDVAALTADDDEIADLKTCRTGDCAFKLAESRIDELRAFDWSAPDARARVEDLVRLRLVEYLQSYQRDGGGALAVYADRRYRTAVAEELHAVLRATPAMYGYTAELERHLRGYPQETLEGASSFFYWAKEKFGLKPTVNMYHVVVYGDPARPDLSLVASKQLYASHYFEAGLELYSLVDHPSGRGTYLFYVGRSRADALRGTFGGLKKSIVQGRALDGLRKAMASIRGRFHS